MKWHKYDFVSDSYSQNMMTWHKYDFAPLMYGGSAVTPVLYLLPGTYISAIHLFICFFVTYLVRKTGARPGLAKEPLIPFNVQKWTFFLNGFPSSINDDFKRGVLRETTPSSMVASRFKYNTLLRSGEFSLAQWFHSGVAG